MRQQIKTKKGYILSYNTSDVTYVVYGGISERDASDYMFFQKTQNNIIYHQYDLDKHDLNSRYILVVPWKHNSIKPYIIKRCNPCNYKFYVIENPTFSEVITHIFQYLNSQKNISAIQRELGISLNKTTDPYDSDEILKFSHCTLPNVIKSDNLIIQECGNILDAYINSELAQIGFLDMSTIPSLFDKDGLVEQEHDLIRNFKNLYSHSIYNLHGNTRINTTAFLEIIKGKPYEKLLKNFYFRQLTIDYDYFEQSPERENYYTFKFSKYTDYDEICNKLKFKETLMSIQYLGPKLRKMCVKKIRKIKQLPLKKVTKLPLEKVTKNKNI